MTQDIEARPLSHIPFGIRAIESGIEVDGIWISPSATPILPASGESSSGSSYKPLSQLGSMETLPQQSAHSERHVRVISDGGTSSTGSIVTNSERDFSVGKGTRAYHLATSFLAAEEATSYALVPSSLRDDELDHRAANTNGKTVFNIRQASSGLANARPGESATYSVVDSHC